MNGFLLVLIPCTAWLSASAQTGLPAEVSRELQFRNAATLEQYQEIATVIRTVAELREVRVIGNAGLLQFRGPSEMVATAVWLFSELDQPPLPTLPAAPVEYQMPDDPAHEHAVRIFRLAHASSRQSLQEAALILRQIGRVRRILTYPSANALIVRGTEMEVKLAAWLLEELDRPVGSSVTTGRELRLPTPEAPFVRVFALRSPVEAKRLYETALELRKTLGTAYVVPYGPLSAIVVRGTPENVATAIAIGKERGW